MRLSLHGEPIAQRPSSGSFEERPKTEGRGRVQIGVCQSDFAAALLNPDYPVPPGLVGPDGQPSTRRFSVYRNNVVAGLTRVMRDAFPATARIVGDEFFAAVARIYVAREPPASPMLFDYGAGFPDFIQAFEALSDLPYLPDVARIDRAWAESYNAPEACPISPATFAKICPHDLPNLRVKHHSSLRVVRSRFPVLTIWQMNIIGGVPETVNLAAGGEDALIIRSDASVELRVLPPGGADFLQTLCDGCSMLEATKAAMAADRRFDLPVNLSMLIAAGTFVGVDLVIPTSSRKADGCRP